MLPLVFDDISDTQTSFDPLVVIEPFPIGREPDSPHPFITTFTPDEFRTFWHHERNAFQWTYFSENNSRFYRDKKLPTPILKSTGRPRSFDWSIKHVCRHFRKETQIQQKNRKSVGQGCTVSIRIQKVFDKDQINVIYYWRHSHKTGQDALFNLPLGKGERKWIDQKISEGFLWKGIMNQLHGSEEWEKQFEDDKDNVKKKTRLPRGFLIRYNSVRSKLYRKQQCDTQKSRDIVKSVELWMKAIQSKGGKSYFAEEEYDFTIMWSSQFQLKVMRDNTLIACMDSTHKTVKALRPAENGAYKSGFLYTLLVKDCSIRMGIPISHMICGSESKYSIIKWLTWLKTDCGLRLEKFMVDCAVIQSEAIKAVFPFASIYYCHFHVAQLWEKYLRQSTKAVDRISMRSQLVKIRRAESKEDLEELWNKFTKENPKAKKFIDYVDKNWLRNEEIRSRWVIYQRENHQHVDTNNLIESWHKTLKKSYLGNRRNARADFLIHTLQKVNQDMRHRYNMTRRGFFTPELSAYDKKRKAMAMALDVRTATGMIDLGPLDENKVTVKSFTTPGTEYSIFLEGDLLLSCSCQDYITNMIPCKHLYLVHRIHSAYRIHYGGPVPQRFPEPAQGAADNIDDIFGPPLETMMSDRVRLQLQASRMLEVETTKRAREEERLEKFQRCEEEIGQLWVRIGNAIHCGNKARRCSLEYFEAAAATLRRAAQEIEGINVVGAGRSCQ